MESFGEQTISMATLLSMRPQESDCPDMQIIRLVRVPPEVWSRYESGARARSMSQRRAQSRSRSQRAEPTVTECVSIDHDVLRQNRRALRQIQHLTSARIKERCGLRGGHYVMIEGTRDVVEQALQQVEELVRGSGGEATTSAVDDDGFWAQLPQQEGGAKILAETVLDTSGESGLPDPTSSLRPPLASVLARDAEAADSKTAEPSATTPRTPAPADENSCGIATRSPPASLVSQPASLFDATPEIGDTKTSEPPSTAATISPTISQPPALAKAKPSVGACGDFDYVVPRSSSKRPSASVRDSTAKASGIKTSEPPSTQRIVRPATTAKVKPSVGAYGNIDSTPPATASKPSSASVFDGAVRTNMKTSESPVSTAIIAPKTVRPPAPPVPAQASGPPATTWACPACTLINPAACEICEACEGPRPGNRSSSSMQTHPSAQSPAVRRGRSPPRRTNSQLQNDTGASSKKAWRRSAPKPVEMADPLPQRGVPARAAPARTVWPGGLVMPNAKAPTGAWGYFEPSAKKPSAATTSTPDDEDPDLACYIWDRRLDKPRVDRRLKSGYSQGAPSWGVAA
eukprot:gnl/TRDRNA2_/TRDRNA2_181878_c0_seq1.p1 gnl/TRDRNA2_/TRDRNA2_181878_c0~~gnl/TRDRNA2_/TRDRNA2_181878_c0_seq1.p1  ORF type:complete len:574 (+),score=83.66 gnl/TRDRNA2_/TRDRNA2_181878_c0_seq1:59-1780(+)